MSHHPESNWGKSILQHEDAYQKHREQTYRYVFGEERTGKEILTDLKKALSQDRAYAAYLQPQEES
jgi:hypothetical protein